MAEMEKDTPEILVVLDDAIEFFLDGISPIVNVVEIKFQLCPLGFSRLFPITGLPNPR